MKISTISSVIRQKRTLLIATIVVAIFGALYLLNNRADTPDETIAPPALPEVTLITPAEFAGQSSLTLLGTARASLEAQITAERSGRITSVPVSLGQRVFAGQTIATIDNASERAAVLQAEGVYEAAVAGAAQTGFSVTEAETRLANAEQTAITTARSAYTTVNGVVVSNIDKFFANPNSPIPGLRVGGQGFTMDLNNERVGYQDLLPAWQASVTALTTEDDLLSELDYATQSVERTIAILDIFLFIFDRQRDEDYANDEITFTNLRATLLSTLSSLTNAKNGLFTATDALNRALATASGGGASAADAQVKQALGALRAAEANLAKTIFRTPISGTVNELLVRPGDFVNSFGTVAVVANNNALEIITAVSEQERLLLQVNDEVVINGTTSGVVTNIAPSISPQTGKFEVRIASEADAIAAGETVRITKVVATQAPVTETPRVPLTAVKFEATDGSVFLVEDGVLTTRAVTIGDVRGSSVAILEGLSQDDLIVQDARGLNPGEQVTVRE